MDTMLEVSPAALHMADLLSQRTGVPLETILASTGGDADTLARALAANATAAALDYAPWTASLFEVGAAMEG